MKKTAFALFGVVGVIVGIAGLARAKYLENELMEYLDSTIEYDPEIHLAVPDGTLTDVRQNGAVLMYKRMMTDEGLIRDCFSTTGSFTEGPVETVTQLGKDRWEFRIFDALPEAGE